MSQSILFLLTLMFVALTKARPSVNTYADPQQNPGMLEIVSVRKCHLYK